MENYIYIFISVASLLLMIGYIIYTNHTNKRAKEVGFEKKDSYGKGFKSLLISIPLGIVISVRIYVILNDLPRSGLI